MTTSKDFCEYVLEQINLPKDIRVRPMMGEYLMYYHDTLIGGIYDERLLLKEIPALSQYNFPQVIPYDGAKRTMHHVEDLDDQTKLHDIFMTIRDDLDS